MLKYGVDPVATGEYLQPCPNKGNCGLMNAEEYYESVGQLEWFLNLKDSMRSIHFDNGAGASFWFTYEGRQLHYRRCNYTKCHLPVGEIEAARINELLGREKPELDLDWIMENEF